MYLSFLLSGQGIQTKDDEVAAISNAPAPADASAHKSFLAYVNFYNRFIPNISIILQPLNRLLGKNIPGGGGDNRVDRSFQQGKAHIMSSSYFVSL